MRPGKTSWWFKCNPIFGDKRRKPVPERNRWSRRPEAGRRQEEVSSDAPERPSSERRYRRRDPGLRGRRQEDSKNAGS